MGTSAGQIRKVLTDLPIPQPWDRRRFVDAVAALRGRPITLIAAPLTGVLDSPCGLWLVREHDDVIIHEGATSEYHRDQIVCHELGHMVLGHDRSGPDASEADPMLRHALPDLDPATVRTVLGRSGYGNRLEREAELFATMVMTAAAPRPPQNLRNVLFRQQ
ncbi:hypothetical protein BJY24_000230 [Nocardia transvalensis]|uniref:IrrE N-terminal-like domain-containing protein n=1 Tax=Nocardia transvalensis TaxID=37333 RepID=A0A7W9P8X9_9NOCA|nr:hypothetical protein [Nocardia transvalensis]MBB5911363.1 hypothetical protein [Nocardia transvalensis]